jgi:hypothetical protein
MRFTKRSTTQNTIHDSDRYATAIKTSIYVFSSIPLVATHILPTLAIIVIVRGSNVGLGYPDRVFRLSAHTCHSAEARDLGNGVLPGAPPVHISVNGSPECLEGTKDSQHGGQGLLS